jgi:hypothetical protein
MAKTRIELLLEEVALRTGKPYYVIWEVYMSEFKKMREEMSTYNFETIKLPYWGKYVASQNKVENYKQKLQIKKDGERTKDSEDSTI